MIVYRLKAAHGAESFVCRAAALTLLLVTLGGCVSGGGRDDGSLNTTLPPAGQQSPVLQGQQGDAADGLAEAKLLQHIDSISELPVPEGISIKLWNEMTAELARVVKRREAGSGGGRASLRASLRPETAALRNASAATDLASRTTLVYDEDNDSLSFAWYMTGDYDQNGLVGISDLTPLGAHFSKTSGTPGEPFPAESIESVVDGDANGLIGIADITPIGAFFGERQLGYRVYRSLSMDDWPEDGLGPNGSGAELVSELPLEQASSGSTARRVFSLSAIEPPAEGQVFYWTRGYDSGAAEGIASLPLLIESEGVDPPENLAPIAVLTADSASGFAPLTVQFNAFSSIDLDGNLTQFEWDWDGPVNGEQWEGTGTDGIVEHEYTVVGDYLPTVRVTDNLGATDTASIPVRVREQIPPVAVLNASHGFGPTPLKVTYDTSMSSDSDGLVELYEWDFDGDGEFEYSSGDSPVADFWYYDPGNHEITVRVTDNDGLSATDSWPVVVQLGMEWEKHTAIEQVTDNDSTDPDFPVALAEVGGSAAILLAHVGIFENGLLYARSLNQSGSNWPQPQEIHPVGGFNPIFLKILNGHPAAFHFNRVIRASDPLGTSWPEGELPQAGSPSEVKLIDGRPAFSGHPSTGAYSIADDAEGQVWPEPFDVPYTASADITSLAEVLGLPALVYQRFDSLYYIRARDIQGADWHVARLVDFGTVTGRNAQVEVSGGRPVIAYYDESLEALKFVRALDSEGEEWGEPRILAERAGGSLELLLVEGLPAMFYGDRREEAMMYLQANDSSGANWGFPSLVDAEAERMDDNHVGYAARHSFAVMHGRPAAVWSYDHEVEGIRYAVARHVPYQ